MLPEPGLASVMRKRQDSESATSFKVNNVIGEACDGQASERAGRLIHVVPGPRCEANRRSDESQRQRHRRTRCRGLSDGPHTNARPGDTRRRLRLRNEWAGSGSPVAQFGFSPSADIFPRDAGRFSRQYPPRASLDFDGPGGLHGGRVLAAPVQAGEQFGSHARALIDRQRQGFAKNVLPSRGHTPILDPTAQPNKALHPTGALGPCVGGWALTSGRHCGRL